MYIFQANAWFILTLQRNNGLNKIWRTFGPVNTVWSETLNIPIIVLGKCVVTNGNRIFSPRWSILRTE